MIERHWKGVLKPAEAQNYEEHLVKDTFVKLATINGFIDARILKRKTPEGVEYLVITRWDSLEAVHAFAGDDVNVAVVPEVAAKMMITFDDKVCHYEMVEEYFPG